MAGFAYYFPGFARQVLSPADLPAELAPILAGVTWANVPLRGPDEALGLAIYPECPYGTQADYTIAEDRWSWRPVERPGEETPAYWLGWVTDQPPKPVDLWRGLDVGGYPVRMGDGHYWTVPAIHAPRTSLPQTFTFSRGEWRAEPLPEYAAVMAETAKWVDRIFGTERFSERDWCDYACQVLGVLYRVGPHEVTALGLLRSTAELMVAVVRAALDWPAIEAEIETQKKTATPAAGSPA